MLPALGPCIVENFSSCIFSNIFARFRRWLPVDFAVIYEGFLWNFIASNAAATVRLGVPKEQAANGAGQSSTLGC
jgi:hypothetical protein